MNELPGLSPGGAVVGAQGGQIALGGGTGQFGQEAVAGGQQQVAPPQFKDNLQQVAAPDSNNALKAFNDLKRGVSPPSNDNLIAPDVRNDEKGGEMVQGLPGKGQALPPPAGAEMNKDIGNNKVKYNSRMGQYGLRKRRMLRKKYRSIFTDSKHVTSKHGKVESKPLQAPPNVGKHKLLKSQL